MRLKVIIVPSIPIVNHSTPPSGFPFKRIVANLMTGHPRSAMKAIRAQDQQTPYACAEVLHYADIPKILGRENTYIVGRYYRDYTVTSVPSHTRYPSVCKTPQGTHINKDDLPGIIKNVDAVIIGKRTGDLGDYVRTLARKYDVLIVIVDHFDDQEVYERPDSHPLTDGLRYGYDYHLFFKHDIPLGRRSDTILPITPMPVRPENFPISSAGNDRDISVFYRGQQRLGVLRDDRHQLSELIRSSIPGAIIDNQPTLNIYSLSEYWDKLSRAKIALTPSGKTWDSTRHCETGMFGCAPFIPEPDCETVNSLVRDGENAITYKTQRLSNGDYAVVNPEETIERVKDILSNEDEISRMSKAWQQEILTHHTTEARARYLLDAIDAQL